MSTAQLPETPPQRSSSPLGGRALPDCRREVAEVWPRSWIITSCPDIHTGCMPRPVPVNLHRYVSPWLCTPLAVHRLPLAAYRLPLPPASCCLAVGWCYYRWLKRELNNAHSPRIDQGLSDFRPISWSFNCLCQRTEITTLPIFLSAINCCYPPLFVIPVIITFYLYGLRNLFKPLNCILVYFVNY